MGNKPPSQRTIELGNIYVIGIMGVYARAKRAIQEQGCLAVFIGANGNAGGCSWRHVDFDRHCRVHARWLVGTYRLSASGSLHEAETVLLDDINFHVLALRGAAAKTSSPRVA